MKTAIFRTGSVPVFHSMLTYGSSRICMSRNDSFTFSGEKNSASSPTISLHSAINRRIESPARSIPRALSDNDLIRSGTDVLPGGVLRQSALGSRSILPITSELDCLSETESAVRDREFLDLSDDGFGKGNRSGDGGSWKGRGSSGDSGDMMKIGDYYREMLKLNPGDSLLLRNYGKYLHEVERDTERAEEYYGRAILAGPGDGELLSLYGKLIWDTRRDGERAKSYFDQAVYASPNDCMVLGSYAHFMWETEEDEVDEESETSPAMAAAF